MVPVLALLLLATPLEEAQRLEDRGDDAGAVTLLDRAVRGDPSWAMGRVELGRLQLKQGASESALLHLDVARSLAPENPRGHYLYALAADEMGLRRESRRALEVALALRSGYADAQVRLASVLMADGEFQLAAVTLKPYVTAHPQANGARIQLAEALERSGDRGGAERELRDLMRVDSVRPLAGRRLVVLLEAAGRRDEAELVRQAVDPARRQLRVLKPSSR